jgi:PAS domain S-box-containing protein
MTSAETDKSTEEIQRLQKRLRHLAEEKSNLQLIMRLIEQLNPLPGIEEMVHTMLLSVVDTVGGTNIKLYYFVEAELRYVDFMGETRILPDFDDPLVAQVAASSAFIEQPGDAESALLLGAVVQGSWTWGFPLLVGKELIGVIKLENLHISGASLRTFLPVFFSHAALILSNEIRAESRKKIENDLRVSEERLRLATTTANIGVWDWDIANNVLTWDESMYALYGIRVEDFGGAYDAWSKTLHPDDRQSAEAETQAALHGEREFAPEFRIVRTDGGVRNIKADSKTYFDPQGKAIRMVGINIDFTERKKLEDIQNFLAKTTNLHASESFFEELARYLSQSLDMFYVCIDRLEGDGLNATTLAIWCDGHFEDNTTYALKDTPCGDVVDNKVCCFPASVCQYFPRDQVLQDLCAESYIGVSLFSYSGQPIGLIAVIGREPLANRPLAESILKLVAIRAAGELERLLAEEKVKRYKDHLEEEVQIRTADLDVANRQLSETQFAMDRAGIGIHWLDDDGRFIYVNEYAAQLLGYSQEQMREMSVPDVDPNFAGKDFKVQTQPLREIGTSTFETAQRHKNGEIIPLEVTFYYQPGKEGSGGRFISFVTDIRQRKQAELVLHRAMEVAEAANQAKSTFLTSMSHELRTPLNAILGFSSLMRRDEQLRPEQRTNLDIINRSGEHLLTLINDILELAKIEAGKTQLNITPFDLGVLVRDVTDMMELRARAKGLRLLIDQSSQFPRYINGDEARLRQILINLLGNAVKFTQQGGVTLRLGTKQNAIAHLIIEIEDTGPGLSAEDQQRLFQPFMQFGKQPGDNKGTGLGLSITRQFVQLMGGNISVESTVGKGSLFRVELPLSEVKEADLLPQHETEKGEVVGLASGQPVYRILIVEDQLENQLLLSQLMQRIGFEIQVAENGAQGVQLFQSWQPHLIFMDRRMPDMDGIAATQAIRQLPGGKEVKIVAVTASAFMEQRDEMMAAGMNDFVRKPYRFNEIYDSLTRQLGVQYRYAETQPAKETAVVALNAAMLTVLPQALRVELKAALESLMGERIEAVLVQIKPYDETLHQTLSRLVENYDYPAILKLL